MIPIFHCTGFTQTATLISKNFSLPLELELVTPKRKRFVKTLRERKQRNYVSQFGNLFALRCAAWRGEERRGAAKCER